MPTGAAQIHLPEQPAREHSQNRLQHHGMFTLEPVAEVLVLPLSVLTTLWLHRQGITNCSVVAVCFHNCRAEWQNRTPKY